ncbi:hypothetical protein KJ966_27230 [bacterium]|nr:hypothetical protein [bacterium]
MQLRTRSPGSSPGQALECRYSIEMLNMDAEGFTRTEGNTGASAMARMWRCTGVLRLWHV